MQPVKKTKLYKLYLFLLGAMVLINFSFCLMPLAVSAQTLNKSEEIVSEISQKDNQFNEEERCEDTSHGYKTDNTAPQEETKTNQNNNAPDKNTVLPCCLDHDRITQINNAPKLEIKNLIFYATSENNNLDSVVPIQDSLHIQLIDLPPPKADVLFSIFKKE